MRRFAIALVALSGLVGCYEDQEQALRKCEFSALPQYKDGWQTWGADSSKYRNYIETCMRAAGYEPNIRPNKCAVGFYTEHNAYCYQPTRWLGRIFWKIEVSLDGGTL